MLSKTLHSAVLRYDKSIVQQSESRRVATGFVVSVLKGFVFLKTSKLKITIMGE